MIYSAEQMFVVFNNIVSDTACGSDIPEVNCGFSNHSLCLFWPQYILHWFGFTIQLSGILILYNNHYYAPPPKKIGKIRYFCLKLVELAE